AWLLWWAFSIVTLCLFGQLLWTHDLMPAANGLFSAAATWADFGLHASLVSHFAAGAHLSMAQPLAAGTPLTYPFLIDFLSGLLLRGGWTIHAALLIPGLFLIMAALQLLLGAGVRLFNRIGGAILGLSLMLTCGSAAGFFVAVNDFNASHQSLAAFLSHLPQDYSKPIQPNAQLINFVSDVLLPQRSFDMGLAVFSVVLVLAIEARRRANLKLALAAGGLVGLLPLIHDHSFIMAAATLAAIWIEALITKRYHHLKIWTLSGIAALIVAAPQILWQALATGYGSGAHWSLGWVINPGESLVIFWANNYGITLLLMVLVALLLALQRRLRPFLVWYAPAAAVFVLANLYAFQGYNYDNHKLIMYAYLMTYLFVGYGATWIIRRAPAAVIPFSIMVMLAATSGTLSIAREFQQHDQFASNDDIALAGWAKRATPPDTVFFANDQSNQPLATLGGRSLVSGYRGWLYSYHIPYNDRIEAIQGAFLGGTTTHNPYHAGYLAVSAYEPSDWTIDQAAISHNYTVVYTNPSWTVYRLPDALPHQ
ncbi:MAG TPA: hypothetical protein VHQ86_05440, partial [Candidatus Saccharimonadia bacterium]|nr:hypothetical protein [Candidatus Saccharimonadia bacterium]